MRTPDFSIGERLDASFKARISQNKPREEDGGRQRYTFVISTGAEDRHETFINPNGGDFRAFMDNPVVLFNHDYDKIVGRALGIEVKGGQVIAQMEFDEDDEFARGIKGKVDRKYLNATSIGFVVKEWSMDEMSEKFRIDSWELVEFSIVSVPSNREALIISRDVKAIAELKQEIVQLKDMVSAMRQPPVQLAGENARQNESDTGVIEAPIEQDAHQPAEPEDIVLEPSDIVTDSEAPHEDAEEALQGDEPGDNKSPESSSAIHDEPTGEPERQTPIGGEVSPQVKPPRRKATQADYERVAQALIPSIRKQVRRSLGKE